MNDSKQVMDQAVRAYFSQPGFSRFLAALRSKYQASRSGPRGYIRLRHATNEERAALDGFYGTYTPVQAAGSAAAESLPYSIKQFERLLLVSRFAMTVPELFAMLDGTNLSTRGELESEEEAAWQAMIRQAAARLSSTGLAASGDAEENNSANNANDANNTKSDNDANNASSASSAKSDNDAKAEWRHSLASWVRGLEGGSSSGYRTLRTLLARQREEAAAVLDACIQALEIAIRQHPDSRNPDAAPLRLPILAARTTGDAHALDWKYPLGRLFWWGLVSVYPELAQAESNRTERGQAELDQAEFDPKESDQPEVFGGNLSRALWIREGYRRGGIADDDLSSLVLFFSPGWRQSWEEQVLTLRQVERLSRDDLDVSRNPSVVYVVENPSVFAVLVDEATRRFSPGRFSPTTLPCLICGNGQPSVAVVKLLELLLAKFSPASPLPMFYSGDLDVSGLEIARSLQLRFPESFHAWRMDTATFNRFAHQGMELTNVERDRMAKLNVPWETSLPGLAATAGIKLHQEVWVDELIEDWARAFDAGIG